MAAVGVTTGAPTVGSPALGQRHALVAVGIAAGVPQLGAPQLNPPAQQDGGGGYVQFVPRIHALRAIGIDAGLPDCGTPRLTTRPSPAALAAEQARLAALADEEDAIAALLLAA
jgi:hypothetical protein